MKWVVLSGTSAGADPGVGGLTLARPPGGVGEGGREVIVQLTLREVGLCGAFLLQR